MAPTVESHGRRIILESDPYVGSWRRKQAEKGIDVLTETCLKKKKKKLDQPRCSKDIESSKARKMAREMVTIRFDESVLFRGNKIKYIVFINLSVLIIKLLEETCP